MRTLCALRQTPACVVGEADRRNSRSREAGRASLRIEHGAPRAAERRTDGRLSAGDVERVRERLAVERGRIGTSEKRQGVLWIGKCNGMAPAHRQREAGRSFHRRGLLDKVRSCHSSRVGIRIPQT